MLTTQVKHVFSSPPPAISQPYIDVGPAVNSLLRKAAGVNNARNWICMSYPSLLFCRVLSIALGSK